MAGIVCAIRGGPSSQPTIDRAIQLAKEEDLQIHFLYVVNLDFLAHTNKSRVNTLDKEMHQMGEFILISAQDRAMARGIHADGVVRNGVIADEIINLARDLEADYVILGSPQVETEANVFTRQRLEDFSQRIRSESGAEVVLVEDHEA
jgi:nucleotide-binding universal stress UspA family protein